jgi:hypothetical protein
MFRSIDQAVTIIPITTKIGPEGPDKYNDDKFWTNIDVILSAVVK